MATGTLAEQWSQWIEALEARGFTVRELLRPGATEVDVTMLEQVTGLQLPCEIRAIYQTCNGQRLYPNLRRVREGLEAPWPPNGAGPFAFYEFLSTQDAAVAWRSWSNLDEQQGPGGMADMAEFVEVSEPAKVKQAYWLPGWLPFATDGGGNSLAFDLDPEPQGCIGQVIIIGPDEDHRRVLAPSISAFIGRLHTEYAAGRFEVAQQGDGALTYDLPFLRGAS